MIKRFWRRLANPSLTARIAGTVVAALVTIQVLSILLFFFLLPEPELRLYRAGELTDLADKAVAAIDPLPTSAKATTLRRFSGSANVEMRVESKPSNPRWSDNSLPTVERLRTSIEERLGARVQRVNAWPTPLQPLPPPFKVWVRVITSNGYSHGTSVPFTALESDTLLPGIFEIGIELKDSTWLVLSPAPFGNHPLAARQQIPMLIGAGLIVALLSAWTSRRLLAPLAGLVASVEQIGRSRSPSPIGASGLREFAPVADALNDMHGRLMRFVDERTQILAAISHDLRTPLTRMRLVAEYVPDVEQRRQLEREIVEMEAMIEATLTFAAQDSVPEARQATDLAAVLISLCDARSDAGDVVGYEGPDHLVVTCQPIAMRRAIANLIDNAIKYGDAAHIALRRAGDRAIVEIRDKGPGIAPDQTEKAFAPFRRLETSRNRDTGGVGLGLTIARDVVRAHGGEIELFNIDPLGLLVRLQLPTG